MKSIIYKFDFEIIVQICHFRHALGIKVHLTDSCSSSRWLQLSHDFFPPTRNFRGTFCKTNKRMSTRLKWTRYLLLRRVAGTPGGVRLEKEGGGG